MSQTRGGMSVLSILFGQAGGAAFLPTALTRRSSPAFCSRFGEVNAIFPFEPKRIAEERGAGLLGRSRANSVGICSVSWGKCFMHFPFEGDVLFKMWGRQLSVLLKFRKKKKVFLATAFD